MSEQSPEGLYYIQDDSHELYSAGDFQGMYDFDHFFVDDADRFITDLEMPDPLQPMLPGTEQYVPLGREVPAPDFVPGAVTILPGVNSPDFWVRVDSLNEYCDWPERRFLLAHHNDVYRLKGPMIVGAVSLTLVAGKHLFVSAEVYQDAPDFTGGVPDEQLLPAQRAQLDTPTEAFRWLFEQLEDEDVMITAVDSSWWC